MEMVIGDLIKNRKTGGICEIVDVVFTDDKKISLIIIDYDGYPTWIRGEYEDIKRDWKPVEKA